MCGILIVAGGETARVACRRLDKIDSLVYFNPSTLSGGCRLPIPHHPSRKMAGAGLVHGPFDPFSRLHLSIPGQSWRRSRPVPTRSHVPCSCVVAGLIQGETVSRARPFALPRAFMNPARIGLQITLKARRRLLLGTTMVVGRDI